jgi:hypothetical protein
MNARTRKKRAVLRERRYTNRRRPSNRGKLFPIRASHQTCLYMSMFEPLNSWDLKLLKRYSSM